MSAVCLIDSPERIAAVARAIPGAVSGIFQVGIAREPWEILGYGALRRNVFCVEQNLFDESDIDEHDRRALPIVAMSCAAGMKLDVIGAVRIYEQAPGIWFGSRLAVDPDWRGVSGLASKLIRAAVCTAHALGARTFLARVQMQNVAMFRRLRWRALGEELVCGREHQLMSADLNHYPPSESLDVPR